MEWVDTIHICTQFKCCWKNRKTMLSFLLPFVSNKIKIVSCKSPKSPSHTMHATH